MNYLINIRKQFESLASNWIDDEERYYSENCHDIITDNRYKDCEYHRKLLKQEIEPFEIPSSRLADGYDYTHIRRLQDYFDQEKFYVKKLSKKERPIVNLHQEKGAK